MADRDNLEEVYQLHQKIRQQATRLKELEQYKNLCEDKILELSPNHPLPIQGSHFGPVRDVQLDGTKIRGATIEEKFNVLLEEYEQLRESYKQVEEALRAESLGNEEQTLYIEVLKQALERRIDEMGLKGYSITDYIEFVKTRNNAEDAIKSQTKMKSAFTDMEAQIEILQKQVRNKEKECLNLTEMKDKYEDGLQQATNALLQAENEIQKLEEEKQSLLQYAKEQSERGESIGEDYEALNDSYSKMQENLNALQRENSALKTIIEDRHLENGKLSSEIKSISEIRLSFMNADKVLKERQDEIFQLKRQVWALQEEVSGIRAQNSSLNEQFSITLAELNGLKMDHQEQSQELAEANAKITQLNEILRQTENSRSQIESALISLDETTELNIKKLTTQIEANQTQIHNLSHQLEVTKQELDAAQHQNQILLSQSTTTNKALSQSEHDLNFYKNEIHSLTENLHSAQSEIEELEQRCINFETENVHLEQTIRRTEQALSSEKWEAKLRYEESQKAKEQIDELNILVNSQAETIASLEHQLQGTSLNLLTVKEQIQKLESEMLADRQEKRITETNLLQLTGERERLLETSQQAKRSLSGLQNCIQTIQAFSRNYGSISTSYSKLSALLSPELKEEITKWKETQGRIEDIEKWLKVTCNELESLIRLSSELRQEVGVLQSKLRFSQDTLSSASHHEQSLAESTSQLKGHVDQLTVENLHLQAERGQLLSRVDYFIAEITELRNELNTQRELNDKLHAQTTSQSTENQQLKLQVHADIREIRSAEERANFAVTEKNELKLLMSKFIGHVPLLNLQRVFHEILRVKGEQWGFEREKRRLQAKLEEINWDQGDVGAVREKETITTSIYEVDYKLSQLNKRLAEQMEELREQEVSERRRIQEYETSVKRIHGERKFTGSSLKQQG